MPNVPELRFPEFSGEWVEKRLFEIGKINPSTPYIPETFVYIDLENVKNGKLLKKVLINKEKAPSRAKRLLQRRDILFQTVRPYQKNNFYFDIQDNNEYIASTGYAVIRTKSFYPKFIYYLLHTEKVVHNVLIKCTGTSYPAINSFDFSRIKLNIPPTLAEQQKIASFLSSIDEKIDLQKQKIEQLEKYKKALLQKLFATKDKKVPELRFPEFSGEWVEKRLGEVLKERKTYAIKNKDYIHLTLSKEGISPKTEQYNRDFLVRKADKKYKITYLNDICYNPANLKFGVICRNKFGKGIFSPIYVTFEVQNSINPLFIEYIITSKTFINKALRYQEGTVYERMAVKPDDMLRLIILIPPTLAEQQKIASFLSSLDEKIELEKEKLDKIKKYKKALLQKMFV